MRCDACSEKIKYNQTYIYKKTEWINFCLECASKYIKDDVNNKDWRISVFNK